MLSLKYFQVQIFIRLAARTRLSRRPWLYRSRDRHVLYPTRTPIRSLVHILTNFHNSFTPNMYSFFSSHVRRTDYLATKFNLVLISVKLSKTWLLWKVFDLKFFPHIFLFLRIEFNWTYEIILCHFVFFS